MNRIAKFEKISYENFLVSYINFKGIVDESVVKILYDDIMLPKRATEGSAGYDFYMIDAAMIKTGDTLLIPTGIRVKMDPSYVLMITPRSGLGFKHRLQLDNTIGIIDSDYYYSDNEGHIFIKMTCDAKNDQEVLLKKGMAFAQGIFLQFGITEDDNVTNKRNGGFGSTNK